MFRRTVSFGGLFLLTALAWPDAARAQHYGGGGGHVGSGGFGGGGRFGGFYSGSYGGYGRYYRPFYGYGFYPYDYGVPYYTGYDTPDYSYGDAYRNPGSAPSYDPTVTSQSLYPPPAKPTQPPAGIGNSAYVTVRLPADARLWFHDMQTKSTGEARSFRSPPLAPGTQYAYTVRATWTENGREVTQTQQVGVTAGARITVDFPEKSEITKEWSQMQPR